MLCIAWSRHCVGSRHGHCNPDGVADIPNGDLKIEDQNTSHGDLPNLRSFLPIFPHENGNNVIEDEDHHELCGHAQRAFEIGHKSGRKRETLQAYLKPTWKC